MHILLSPTFEVSKNMPKFKSTAEIMKIVRNKDQIRNIGIIAHVDHGKTTMTDSLLAAAGVLSPSVAGEALALDYLEEEQKRQMTIKAANISLYHERGGNPFVINLIDTPGHIDFTGRVTRSLRAIDGAVVVVDAVEEVMVQTETVTRQALEERVRPVLYVNKIDRLIKELRLNSEQLQNKLAKIITQFNKLIEMYAESEFKEKWKVNPAAGTVAFGSAKDRWGFTSDIAQQKGIKFSDVVSAYNEGRVEELTKIAPLHEAILNMVTDHMPPPHVAQQYRVPKIWRGDVNSEIGKAMVACDDNGPVVMCINDVKVDPQAGVVATGRLFSGTVNEGAPIYLINAKTDSRIQQVCIYMGAYREIVGSLPAGNIPALLGLQQARAGETLATSKDLVPFEAIHYVSEPVVTMAIEPKHSRDLPKLVDFLHKLSIEDPTLVTTINEETGEYLISGMGTLHLEIATTWIQKADIEITTSKPIVIYRESIRGEAGPFEVRSPNRHNKLQVKVQPLEPLLIGMVRKGEISENLDKKALAKILRDQGWDADAAKSVWAIEEHGNMLIDVTKGVQRLEQVKGSIYIGFMDSMHEGPLAREQMRGVKVFIEDASIHTDPAHFGPAQMIPATRHGIFAGILSADPALMEPIYKIVVTIPPDLVGAVTRIISQKRGKIISIDQREYLTSIVGEIPAAESFDLSEVMRSASGGRAFWQTTFDHWEYIPASLQMQVIQETRKRKGLSPEPPSAQSFLE